MITTYKYISKKCPPGAQRRLNSIKKVEHSEGCLEGCELLGFCSKGYLPEPQTQVQRSDVPSSFHPLQDPWILVV